MADTPQKPKTPTAEDIADEILSDGKPTTTAVSKPFVPKSRRPFDAPTNYDAREPESEQGRELRLLRQSQERIAASHRNLAKNILGLILFVVCGFLAYFKLWMPLAVLLVLVIVFLAFTRFAAKK